MYSPLEVIFIPSKCAFLFQLENVQQELYKIINIKEVISFEAIMDLESDQFHEVDFRQYNSYYELQMVSDEEIRFCDTITVLSNGIKIVTGLNLTDVIAPYIDMLFKYMAPVFEAMGHDLNEVYTELIEYPDERLVFDLESAK